MSRKIPKLMSVKFPKIKDYPKGTNLYDISDKDKKKLSKFCKKFHDVHLYNMNVLNMLLDDIDRKRSILKELA